MTKEPNSEEQSKNANSKSSPASQNCAGESKVYKITIPMKLPSVANIREHWSKSHKRNKQQELLVRVHWHNNEIRNVKLPVEITLTRLSPRKLDDDNLATAFKKCRDVVSDFLIPGLQPGRADDSDLIAFKYAQAKSKEPQISIEAKEL